MYSRLGIDLSSVNPSPEELQQKLEATRGLYERACARLDGKDQEWEVKKTAAWYRVGQMVHHYDPKTGDAAYTLGYIRNIFDELDAPRFIKMEWESMRARWEEIQNRANR